MGDYGFRVSQKGYDVKTVADKFLSFTSSAKTLKVFNVYSISGVVQPNLSGEFTASLTDVITSAGHGLSNGQRINFIALNTLPTPLIEGTDYYIINKTTDTFKVSLTLGGTAIDITNVGIAPNAWVTAATILTVTHNLGYLSPFVVVYNGNTASQIESVFFNYGNFYRQYADRVEIEITPGSNTTEYYTVYVFLDDFTTYTSSNTGSGGSSGVSSNDYGIRVSKEGYDVKTCTDEQCIVSSSFFTSIIHKVGTTTTSNINHGLGYLPSYFAYVKYDGDSHLTYSPNVIFIDDTYLYPYGVGATTYYVIFKNTY